MNLELVEKIVGLLSEYPVSEIAVEREGQRVLARKPLGGAPAADAPWKQDAAGETKAARETKAAAETPAEAPKLQVLTAPMVGIFYHAEPPLLAGAKIEAGQTIGSIESMKLMNDVAAEASGQVADVLVEDGAPVDYGRALFRLRAFQQMRLEESN